MLHVIENAGAPRIEPNPFDSAGLSRMLRRPPGLFKFKTLILLFVVLFSGNGLLQAAPTLASVIKAEEADGKPPVLVDGGLLGALGAGMDEVQDKLGLSMHLLDTWGQRTERAADEVGVLVEQASSHPSWSGLADFFLLSVIWFGAFFGLMFVGRWLARYLLTTRPIAGRPRIQALVKYVLQRFQIDPKKLDPKAAAQQIVVRNLDELKPWLYE